MWKGIKINQAERRDYNAEERINCEQAKICLTLATNTILSMHN